MGPKKSKVDTETSGSLIKSWEVSKHRSQEQSMSGIKENNMEVKVSLKQTDKGVCWKIQKLGKMVMWYTN